MKREAVKYLMQAQGISHRRACRLIRQPRNTDLYRSVKDPQVALRQRLHELSRVRVRYGYRRLHVLLRREGCTHGRNTTYRLYVEERLQLRSKLPRRRKMVVTRSLRLKPTEADQAWTMDFVADQLSSGAKIRALTIVDVFSREALAIEVGSRLRSEHVVAALDRLVAAGRKPKYLFVDNGSEFSGRLLDLWAYRHRAHIDFSRPGKPTDNAHVESFNGSLRDECLNVHWFDSLDQAKVVVEAWRRDYNESRPHMALGNASPGEFARRSMACRKERLLERRKLTLAVVQKTEADQRSQLTRN